MLLSSSASMSGCWNGCSMVTVEGSESNSGATLCGMFSTRTVTTSSAPSDTMLSMPEPMKLYMI